jgi:hypothetical protein
MPIERACHSVARLGTSSSPIAMCRSICLGGVPVAVPASTTLAMPEVSVLSHRCWNRLIASTTSNGSG